MLGHQDTPPEILAAEEAIFEELMAAEMRRRAWRIALDEVGMTDADPDCPKVEAFIIQMFEELGWQAPLIEQQSYVEWNWNR